MSISDTFMRAATNTMTAVQAQLTSLNIFSPNKYNSFLKPAPTKDIQQPMLVGQTDHIGTLILPNTPASIVKPQEPKSNKKWFIIGGVVVGLVSLYAVLKGN